MPADAHDPDARGSAAGTGQAANELRGKRQLPRTARSVRRDITLPRSYDQRLLTRMQTRGVGRSKALRQCMDEADGRHATLCRQLRSHATAARAALSRLTARHPLGQDAADFAALRQLLAQVDACTGR